MAESVLIRPNTLDQHWFNVAVIGSLAYGIAFFSLAFVSQLEAKAPLLMSPVALLALILIKLYKFYFSTHV